MEWLRKEIHGKKPNKNCENFFRIIYDRRTSQYGKFSTFNEDFIKITDLKKFYKEIVKNEKNNEAKIYIVYNPNTTLTEITNSFLENDENKLKLPVQQKPLKLFQLHTKIEDDLTNLIGMVIYAENEEDARKIASENEIPEYMKKIWLNEKESICFAFPKGFVIDKVILSREW